VISEFFLTPVKTRNMRNMDKDKVANKAEFPSICKIL